MLWGRTDCSSPAAPSTPAHSILGVEPTVLPPLWDRTDRSTPAWASPISPRLGLSNQSPKIQQTKFGPRAMVSQLLTSAQFDLRPCTKHVHSLSPGRSRPRSGPGRQGLNFHDTEAASASHARGRCPNPPMAGGRCPAIAHHGCGRCLNPALKPYATIGFK